MMTKSEVHQEEHISESNVKINEILSNARMCEIFPMLKDRTTSDIHKPDEHKKPPKSNVETSYATSDIEATTTSDAHTRTRISTTSDAHAGTSTTPSDVHRSLQPQMTPNNVAVPNCMASTPRIRKSYELPLKLFRPFCECGRLSQLTPALVTTIGVDAVQLYKPTLPMLIYSSKLHNRRETAKYLQLAQHTQPYQASSEAAQLSQVSTVSLYAPSFLLTTSLPLKEPLKNIYDAIEYLYDAVPTAVLKELKEQVINQPKYRSCPSAEEETLYLI